MPAHIKKTISVILLFIFLYNISGYYFVFSVQQTEVKKIVRNFFRANRQDDLIVLKISDENEKEIQWYGKDEFSLDGKMYDLAFRKHEGNILLLYCRSDSKEDHLFTSLDSHIKSNIPAPEKNSKNSVKNPLTDYFADLSKKDFFAFDNNLRNKIELNFFLENFCIEKPSPPPRLA